MIISMDMLDESKTYYDENEIKEVSLDSNNNYGSTMFEYDDNKELIGITQKIINGKIISHIEF